MSASHFEFLVEERSMEEFLRALLPRLLPQDRTFGVHSFQGKADLLGKLSDRLRGYSAWVPEDWRIVVIVDRDDDDCRKVKANLEKLAVEAGLQTKTSSRAAWQLVNRIAVEELEAWYFGDWEAVRTVYPRIAQNIPANQKFRDPDAIRGGTWEAFERITQKHGYFKCGLAKIEAARAIGAHVEPKRNRSASFKMFWDAIAEAIV